MDRTVAPGAANGGSTPPRSVKKMYKIIDGKKISNEIIASIKEQVILLSKENKFINIVDIKVGNDEASSIYMEAKGKKLTDIGINFTPHILPDTINEKELLSYIDTLNNDKNVDGIFLELPLPKSFNEKNVIDHINYKKDVDGFNIKNVGALASGLEGFYPCTAEGIVELIKKSNIDIKGKHCVILGRSNVVGKPVALLMLNENATVTICHSKSENLKEICKTADILIVAIGKKKFIDESYIKEGAVVIDAGINRDIIDGKKIVCGDVDFDKVAPHTSYITPVPGGVGPMTIAMLMKHLIKTKSNE